MGEAVTTALARWDVAVDACQLGRLQAHFEAVVTANRRMNLTRITDPLDAAIKHYADSLALLPWIRERGIEVTEVLDIGTGAGFPAVPLAIMRPDWSVTVIDAARKKVEFVRRTADAIGLTNLRCEHAHSQHWKPGRRFQLVVCRALASLLSTLQKTADHVGPGGWLVLYQTARSDPEKDGQADRLAEDLGLQPVERYPYDLRLGEETLERVLYVVRKS